MAKTRLESFEITNLGTARRVMEEYGDREVFGLQAKGGDLSIWFGKANAGECVIGNALVLAQNEIKWMEEDWAEWGSSVWMEGITASIHIVERDAGAAGTLHLTSTP